VFLGFKAKFGILPGLAVDSKTTHKDWLYKGKNIDASTRLKNFTHKKVGF